MSEENRTAFFDSWLNQYSDRLQQVCHGVREKMQTLYSEATQIAQPPIKSSESAVPGSRPLNL